jgi:hypothetical protein
MAPTPEAVVRQWFKEVWDEGREEAIDRLAAPNLIVHGLGGPSVPPLRSTANSRTCFTRSGKHSAISRSRSNERSLKGIHALHVAASRAGMWVTNWAGLPPIIR